MTDTSQQILLILLIGVLAAATDTDLATNTNILLLLLLFLTGQNSCGCNTCNSCGGAFRTSFFPF